MASTNHLITTSCIIFALMLACHAQSACRINPCLNGGSCRDAILSPFYVCLCVDRWMGQDCEREFPQKNCGANSYTETGTIISPNFPNSHGFLEHCLYLVRVPEAETITINFNTFESELNKDELFIAIGPDFVDLRDLDSENLPEGYIRFHGGPLFDVEPITFNTNQLTLLWDSDRNIIRQGFSIYYTRETDPCWMNQCENGGECQAIDGEQYVCRCLVGWSGTFCADGAILVKETNIFLISGSPLIEGRNNHIMTFNLAVFPDQAVTYTVIGTNLWTISVFLSNQQDGQGARISETVAPLSSEQMSASWIPTNPMNIGNVQTVVNLDAVTCTDMWYVCATIDRGQSPSRFFYMEGSPTNSSLTGCTIVSCTGVRIVNTKIIWKSQNDLREGFQQQNIQFDIRMTPDPAGGSVTGINLWRVRLFGNINLEGSGPPIKEQEIPIVEPNSRRSIQAGVQTTLSDLTTTINMLGLRCSEMPYICVEVLPGRNADPTFTLTGDLIACFQIPCRGVNIIDTSFEIDIGNPLVERSNQHEMVFDLLLQPDQTGGAAIGSNLWAVTLFATSGSSSNRVSPPVQVALNSGQSGTSLRPPGTSRIASLQASLNLQGRLCSDLLGVCAVLSKGPLATPDFTFETALTDPALTACLNVECQGVTFSGINLNMLNGNQFQIGHPSFNVDVDFRGFVDGSGASVSGSGLWQMIGYLSTDADGFGQRIAETQFSLSQAQQGLAANAGTIFSLPSLMTTLDLSGVTSCSQFNYFCVDLRKGDFPTPDFTLSGTVRRCVQATCGFYDPCVSNPCQNGATCTSSSGNYFCSCQPGYSGPTCSQVVDYCLRDNIVCQNGGTCTNQGGTFVCLCRLGWQGPRCRDVDLGVQLSSCQLSISYGNLRERQQTSPPLNLNVVATSDPNSQSISGSGLWSLEVFSNTEPDGSGVPIISQTLPLSNRQSGTSLFAGGTAIFNDLSASIDLSDITCDAVPYLCVRVLKGDNPSPEDFVLTGNRVSCVESQCKGVEVTRVSSYLMSGSQLLIGEPSHNVVFDLYAWANAAGASISGENLWRVSLFTNTQIDGMGQTGAEGIAVLTTDDRNQDFIAGQQLRITNARAQLNLQQLTCQQSEENPDVQVTHLCVRLERQPTAIPVFTLTGIPSDDILSYCQRVNCQAPSPCNNVDCQNGGQCQEISDGVTDFFVCNCPIQWTGQYCEQRVNFCSNIQCLNGGTCQNLASNFICNCVLGWKGTQCETQDAVIITLLQSISRGYLGEGKASNPLTFDLSFTSDPRGSDAVGTGLWKFNVFSSTVPDGSSSGYRAVESVINFNQPGQASTSLTAGATALFNGLTANLDLSGVPCELVPYICVELQKGDTPNPEFVLTGQTTQCVPVECRGVQIISSDVSLTSAGRPLNERRGGNSVTYDLTLTSSSTGGSVIGSNLWSVTTFLNSREDGRGTQIAATPVNLSPQQGATSLQAGETSTIAGISSALDLNNVLCSDDIQYVCTSVERNPVASVQFTLNPPVQTSCTPIDCKGVEVTRVDATVTPSDTTLRVGDSQNTVNFGLRVSSNSAGADIDGNNLWLVDVYTSNRQDGSGVQYGQSQAVFTSGEGLSTPLFGGVDMILNGGQVRLDLSSVQSCENQVSYLCFRLRRNPLSSPEYTLTGFPKNQALDECIDIQCEEPSPCENHNCQNNGVCIDAVVGYTCNCNVEWLGTFCQIRNPCEPDNPCQYGGRCVASGTGSYSCQCPPGYSGTNCESAPDPCNNLPCLNGGVCLRVGTGILYTCTCPAGYTGQNCGQQVGACAANPCRNGATCYNSADGVSYACQCLRGWKGMDCQYPAPCVSSPCQNGGLCNSPADGSSYTCQCQDGFQGYNCQFPNPCFSSPCANGGTCQTDSIGSLYICFCPAFFFGANCEQRDPCYSSPCKNGGACVGSQTSNAYECSCRQGWLGPTCEIDDPCMPSLCQNGGTCYIGGDMRSYTCQCREPFIGTMCEKIDRCIPDPCQNDGICSTTIDGALHICRCPEDWQGYNCQDPNYCASEPCQNGGFCIPNGEGTGYLCNCPLGYSGDDCESIDPCSSSPCLNGGECLNSASRDSYLCQCTTFPIAYYGSRCQTIDPCTANPCVNGGFCTATNDGLDYNCQCLDNFYGPRCEIYDPCASNPCMNSGLCQTSTSGTYTCQCAPGFSGLVCEIAVNCNPSPCQFGGVCQVNVNNDRGYTCLCPVGFYGTHCGNRDLCTFEPCENGGTCAFDADSATYTCTCRPGYYGDNCVDTSPCSPNNPCQNGGLCNLNVLQPNGYSCICQRGFSGFDCQIVCPGFACANGQCVQGAFACDNIAQCTDGSDEAECATICGVRCDGGTKCLNASTECDGIQNCADNSDEAGCDSTCKPNPCRNAGACLEVQINSVPDFECVCTVEWKGRTCREPASGQNLPPGFDLPDGLTKALPENAEEGTFVFQLLASDPENDNLTYSLYDGVAQSLFTIDPITGQLFLKAILDRETQTRYNFIVAVSDGRNTVTQEGDFTVTDVNDNAPIFSNLPATVRVSEAAPFGTQVYRVEANDIDTLAGGLVTYLNLNNSVPFSIQLFNGQISVSDTLDYEAINEYQLFINAADLGVPSFNSTGILTVIIEDVQDSGPMFISEPYDTAIDEGTPIGTPVVTVIAEDQDTLNQNPIVYDVISGNEGSYFALNQNSGEITVIKDVDKDVPGFPEEITFTIRATEIGETGDITEDFTTFSIIVNDIADEPPVFGAPLYIVTTSESNLPGFALPINIDVNDGDQTIDNAFTVRIEPNNVPFTITPTTAVGEATLQVMIRQLLDYETTQIYQFQLVATEETGSTPQSGTTTIQVQVLDANDNDPIFDGPISPISINEGVGEGYQVITVGATDRDTGVNADTIYRIVSGNNDNLFRIDEQTGAIVVNVPELDYETTGSPTYVLTVEALNTAEPVAPARGSSTTSVTIHIVNLNDNAPVFDPAVYMIPISEITEPGLTIGRVVATDPDPGPAGDVRYYIVSGNDGTFEVDPITGNIQLVRGLDRETKSRYTLTIQANDQGNPVLNSRTTVTVDVSDFNDNDPEWTTQSYAVNIREGEPANTFVTQVRATDADIGINAQLVYDINPINSCFTIDSESGQITTTKPLDRENATLHTLSVTVKDSGNPQRSASRSATVRVTVTDVNDSPPSFMQDEYVYEIQENLQGGTAVGQLTATDPDITGSLIYEFDPILSDFSVIASSGAITTNRPLDRENQAEYQTIARVRDGQRVDTALVRILVLDVNDNNPAFNQTTYVVDVLENSPVPTVVKRLLAEDPDEGTNGEVTYRFTGDGNTQGPFNINPTSGVLATSTQLDYETMTTWTLDIEAIDGGVEETLMGYTTVIVNVVDVNDNGPRFAENSYDQRVPEDVDEDDVIITVVAEDRDSPATGPVMYRIVQGNGNGTFIIDPLTGEITRGATPLDRETKDSYFLIVEAYNEGDADVPTDTAIISINIDDVNDEAPTFSQEVYTRPDLPEDSAIGTSVIILSALDRDLGAGGQVRYNIIEGNNQGIFAIDPDTGAVTLVTRLPSVETTTSYNLTITATDQAAPNFITPTNLIIQIRPSQEIVPVFSMSRYVVNVTENVDVGTAIVEVLATLPDGSFIMYYMDPNVNPTIVDLFGLHPNSGEITTEGPIDREQGDLYTFTVLAINGGTVPGSAAVWVYVLDENDNAPEFVRTPGERVIVSENLPAGTVVGEFEAQDLDQDQNGEVTYYISGGDVEGYFRIEFTSDGVGQLVTTRELDREVTDTYNLIITAADLGATPQESSVEIEVIVSDVNDNPPLFANISFMGVTEEGTLSNRPVVTILIDDLDLPATNNLEFVIISGDPDGIFTIDSNGEVIQTVQLDRETQASYNLTIVVTDSSFDTDYEVTTYAYISVTDTNDNAPEFIGAPYSVNVTEGPGSGNVEVVTVITEDGDTGGNGEVIYTIIRGNSGGEFVIDPTTGVISTTMELDRETESTYNLIVVATDQAVEEADRQTSTALITITVGDINDSPPRFEEPYNGPYVIPEGVPNSYIGTFVAIDLDGDGTGITYNITGEYSELFIIDPDTGVLTLRPDRVLDFEISPGFNITIVAEDNGMPPLSGTTIIEIVVDNVNDNTPQFAETPYSTLVNENTTVATSVFTISATDADQGPSGELRFEIIGGNSERTFRIDPVTGVVYLDKPLDFDQVKTYELLISVRDNPNDLDNSLSVNTVLTIGVLDSTDLPPTFPGEGAFFGSVFEHSPRGTVVDMVEPIEALDEDTTMGLSYSITGDSSDIFSIDTGTGILRVADRDQLDREVQDMHTFNVLATDSKGRSAVGTVTVTVLDINDQPPSFNRPVFNFTLPEDSEAGYLVGQVSATDMDSSSTLQYIIDRGDEGNFVIDAITGEITVSQDAALNRELQEEYILMLSVSDQGVPPLTGNGIVYIRLTDINDDAPFFDADMLQIETSILENSPLNTPVTMISAQDRDSNAQIEYSVVSYTAVGPDGDDATEEDIMNWFMVNPNSGLIYVNGGVDRETAVTVHLEVSATDTAVANPALGTSNPNAKVTIHILDENDNAPYFLPDGTQFILVALQEGSPRGTIVIDVDAMDLDAGANGHISYYKGDLQQNVFDLDQNSGIITVRTPINREQYPWVNFTIGAVDDGGEATVIPIYVQITDINDNNPVFDQEQYKGEVSENVDIGYEVLVVTATDADIGAFANLTYSLSGGNGDFTIDPITGVISVAKALDKETIAQYTLTVRARDNYGSTTNRRESSVEVVIDILDSNEFAPVVDPEYPFTVPEGQPPGTSIGIIDAVDPDDPTQDLIFIIIGTEPEDGGGLIYIDETTGEVFTNASLDRDNSTYGDTIIVIVEVSDGGTPAMVSNTTIVVNIGDINDNAPFFPDGPYEVPLSEVARVGSPVVVIRADDPDLNSELIYSIIGGNVDDTFLINPETGEVIIKNPLNFDATNMYNLLIQVEDQGGFTATTTLQVDISDANNNGPTFIQDPYEFDVYENSPLLEVVGKVEAIDRDRDSTIFYGIVGGNGGNKFAIDSESGLITVTGELDRERKGSYTLQVEARDEDVDQYRDTASVIITILDENDMTPQFSSNSNYTKRIQENTEVDSLVILLPATDGDIGENGRITYHIVSGNIGDTFRIDEATGAVTVRNLVSSLNPPVYQFILDIEARDQGDPSLTGTIQLIVNIGDTNDRSPVFISPTSSTLLELPENEPIGYVITQVLAIDDDIGVNGEVTYSLDQAETLFYIDPNTGVLYANFTADREVKDTYSLILLATDNGEPTRTTHYETTIIITDKDDNLPYFERLDPRQPTPQNLDVPEHSNTSTVVDTVIPAIDDDLGDNAIVYYYIVDGNENNQFEINSTTGELSVIGDLDRETTPTITLIIKATNESDYTPMGPYDHLTDTSLKEVIIHLGDINDNGPVFAQSIYVTSVPLDAEVGELVLEAIATDPDIGAGGNIEYEISASSFIINGRTNSADEIFIIEKNTGRLLTNKMLTDYVGGYFDLTITAIDVETGLTAAAAVRIYVLDNNQRVVVVVDADLQTVKALEDELIDLLENITGGIVIVDEVTYYTDKNGVTHDDQTMMVIHVIDRETGEIIPADDILIIIDDNYTSIEQLLIKYGVIKFYPVLGGRGSTGLAILEWALLAIALLLFLGALIFIIILCCLRRRMQHFVLKSPPPIVEQNDTRLLKKIQGGSFITGSRKDVSNLRSDADVTDAGVKRSGSTAQSFSGSNPMWATASNDDWPDSISLINREYEAQEASMDFFQDDTPVEVARDAVIMTSLVSEKAMMDSGTASAGHLQSNGGFHSNGGVFKSNGSAFASNGGMNSGRATLMHLDNEQSSNPMNSSRYIDVSNLSNTRSYDGSVSAQLSSFAGGAPGRGLTDEKAFEIRQMLNEQRDDNFNQKGQLYELDNMLSQYQNTGPTSVHIQHRPDDISDSDEDELAAAIARASYREQIEFDNALTPITEMTENSESSVTSASLANESRRAMERNSSKSPYRKDYSDPMSSFTTTEIIEENFQSAEIISGDKRQSQKGYASKKTSSKGYGGGAAIPRFIPAIPEETREDAALLNDDDASSGDGMTYTYHVNPDGVDQYSIGSNNLSSAHTTDEELSNGRGAEMNFSDNFDEDYTHTRRSKTTTAGLSNGYGDSYFGVSDEESQL